MYPFDFLHWHQEIFPLFSNQLQGPPHIFDFSSRNPKTLTYETTRFEAFQKDVVDELQEVGCQWGVGLYLQERRNVLRNYPHMLQEGRIYHAGVDIIVPEGFTLYAPIGGTVFKVGKEEGVGNYGGYVVLRHELHSSSFYSLYGHLDSHHRVKEGDRLSQGQPFGRIGVGEDSGQWFTHTHLQVITEEALKRGRMFHGYVTAEDLTHIEDLFPTPYPLFRF